MVNYLDELNEPQREAVLHKDGPIMIIAGAGSGKTKVLTTRIAHLMGFHDVDAFNILALTFTNKAAKEMKARIERTLGNSEARNLYIGTFHSVFARILRAEANKIGYPHNFTIYDTDDAKSVLKTVIHEMELDDKHYKPGTVYNRISSAKNSLIGPAEYINDWAIQQEDARANRPLTGKIYDGYNKRCFKNGAMDFDDLLFKMYELLKYHPEALSKYQRKFKYILIDEYQDTNTSQYEIIKLLGAMHENICVVGDDAQSIYSFRGATIENILQFAKNYDDVKLVKLEQNYRSTKSILNVANEIIGNNKNQLPKKLWTDKGDGDKIKLVRTATDNEEGKFVADTIQEEKLRNHFFNNDFAILYRTNAQSRSYEESLRRMNIAYRIYGGLSFYQRKEIKDYVAYLRIVVNPSDEEALKRIINYPTRGIGKTSMDRAVLAANENNITLWEVLVNAVSYGYKGGTLEAISNFVTMIKMFQSELPKKNAYDLAIIVGKSTQIVKELFNDKTTEGLARYENVQELLNSIKEFIETPLNEEDGEVGDKSLGTYLQQITLLTDTDNDKGDVDSVKLMTIHAAKGLEFSCVFVGGLEETLFPSAMSINTREELEEERRLFYVAITRAKAKLWLTYANARYRFGQLQQNEPSRFIDEM
ncbi:MAG: UvrD-helicase domain-containing protein, partial [Ferruginibacter sp.]